MQGHLQSVFLAVILLAGLTAALTLEETARFYVKSGETFKTEAVTLAETKYYVLKIDGEPYVVLGQTEEGYAALKDEQKLDEVLREYARLVFEQKSWEKSVGVLNESKSIVDTVIGDCVVGGRTFLENIPRRVIRIGNTNVGLWFLITRSQNGTYKAEYDAITGFNKSFGPFDAAYQQFIEKSGLLAKAVEGKDATSAFEAIGVIRSSTAGLKKEYTSITSAYATLGASKDFKAILLFTFYEDGKKHTCAFNANATAALTKVETEFSDKSTKALSELKATVLAKTKERESAAVSRTTYAIRQDKLSILNDAIANVTKLYEGGKQTVSFTDLNKKKEQLGKSLENIKAGNASASEFDTLAKKIEEDLQNYKQFADEFKSAAVALAQAEANFSQALKRYGDADPRVAELRTQLDALKKNLSQNILSLQSGDFAKARFTNVTTTAKSFAATAGELKPKESEIDPVIIGAVVALLLGLGGTVYYFKKMKGGAGGGQQKELILTEEKK